jgi:hypothetical protein
LPLHFVFFLTENIAVNSLMMAGETTMIIITSNEDIIRQFSSEKPKNTQIINLNNTKQTIDTNIINLAFLDELSQPVCILF